MRGFEAFSRGDLDASLSVIHPEATPKLIDELQALFA